MKTTRSSTRLINSGRIWRFSSGAQFPSALPIQRVRVRRCVHPPEVMALRILHQLLAAKVGGHDDDGVLEIHCSSMGIGESSIFEDLQKQVEDVVMCFFDFIKEDDAVGFASDRFRCPPSSKPTYPGGAPIRRETACFSMYSDISIRIMFCSSSNKILPGIGQFGLADPGGSEKDETAHRPAGVIDPGSGTDHGIGNRIQPPAVRPPDGADVPEAGAVFTFSFHHPPNGDAGPSRDDFRNILRPDFFTKQLGFAFSLPV